MNNIELKNIKTYTKLSKETTAFNAKLYFDGQYIADISNTGNGGCHQIHVKSKKVQPMLNTLNEIIEKMPPYDSPCGKIQMNLDLFITLKIEKIKMDKELKSMCKRRTVFLLHDEPDDIIVINSYFDHDIESYLYQTHGNNLKEIVNKRYV